MPNFGFTAFYEVRRTLLRRTSRGTNLLRRQKSVGSRWVVGGWKSFQIRRWGCRVNLIEVEALNFVLYIGHLGWREPVVQPAISRMKEVAHEAHLGVDHGGVSYGGNDVGHGDAR